MNSLTSLRCLQQRRCDLLPFHFKGSLRRGAAGAPVPVAGIACVAFHPMQMGVDPGAGAIVLSLSKVVSPIPVAPCLVPQRLQRQAQPAWRRLLPQCLFECVQIHRAFDPRQIRSPPATSNAASAES